MSFADFTAATLPLARFRRYPWEFRLRVPYVESELRSRHRTYSEGARYVEETINYLRDYEQPFILLDRRGHIIPD